VYLNIALPVLGNSLFDYLPLEHLQPAQLLPGVRYLVPYGHQTLTGILIGTSTSTDCPIEKLKPIIKPLDEQPLLNESILSLCKKAAMYYHRSLGETLSLALPKKLRKGQYIKKNTVRAWKLSSTQTKPIKKTANKQMLALTLLKQFNGEVTETQFKEAGISTQTIKALSNKSIIHLYDKTLPINDYRNIQTVLAQPPLALNDEQQTAVNTIHDALNTFFPVLLHGVTGSGKTEVYLQIIEKVLTNKRQALVLVPEIGLTPQTLQRFQQRFAIPIAVLHSNMSDTERYESWMKVKNAEAGILISTRSGIFTSFANLGLIVVDEEHDTSYKQQESIRYSARDLALLRSQMEKIPIILGSATPSMESLKKAWSHHYHYMPLTQRAGNAAPPTFQLIDIRHTELHAGLSPCVIDAIDDTLNNNRQVLIFINRRGFAPSLICVSCGKVFECQHCDAYLTLHRSPSHLHCHHCNHQEAVPSVCDHCKHADLIATGTGTERTEMALNELFPNTEIIRIDRDSVRKKQSLQTLLNKINKNEPAILIGTQMLAKGHHFTHVTLVIIINADAGFFSTDFRGEEKTAQLITQVAGRAGRGDTTGKVLIQTYNPYNPHLITLTEHNYTAFAKAQLASRKSVHLPPYSYLALFTAESSDRSLLHSMLEQVNLWSRCYQKQHNVVTVIGPMPAPMEKKQGKYRGHILFKTSIRSQLHRFLHWLQPQLYTLPRKAKFRWVLDIDPQETI